MKSEPCLMKPSYLQNGTVSSKIGSNLSAPSAVLQAPQKTQTMLEPNAVPNRVTKKSRKKKTARACINCQKAHLTCDEGRPCQRCTRKGLTNCVDGFRKQAKYLMDIPPDKLNPPPAPSSVNPATVTSSILTKNKPIQQYSSIIIPNASDANSLNTKTHKPPISLPSSSSSLSSKDVKSPLPSSSPDLQPIIAFPPFDFSSKAADLEYSSITSLLESDVTLPSITDNLSVDHTSTLSSHMHAFFQDAPAGAVISPHNHHHHQNVLPLSAFSQHSSPAQSSEPKPVHQINKTPEEVYNNVDAPFPYTQGYHILIMYLKRRFNNDTLMVLAKSMAEYRPSFIATTKTLQEADLIFMEKCFQRTLLEFNKFILCSGTPTVVWRRTGQIAAAGREFCLLTGWRLDDLVTSDPTKSKFIIELMDDSSVTKYFDVFTRLAFGDSRGVIMTDCTLLKKSGKHIRTACTWTVKRDVFDIPMMIIGNFLPILE